MSKTDTTEYRLTEAERYAIYCALNHCMNNAICDIGRIEFRQILNETDIVVSVPDDQYWKKYYFTSEQYSTIIDALDQARDDAIHKKVYYRMKEAARTLINQSDHHDETKQTTSTRWTEDNKDE